ncbi:hypothetical protein [Bifidobacterium cuniculi]|uniref:Uncharacterized protein n=1 Tax=Bifidobacterium cuniculi TaxID=1688 RepID=A0A087AZM1_9BIFI|nr:hypothetical protein [Bifidobacterium cuniculi]KFI64221.1 hypothetical protein BCUN_2085 [Bifidobacterium cuniculi]
MSSEVVSPLRDDLIRILSFVQIANDHQCCPQVADIEYIFSHREPIATRLRDFDFGPRSRELMDVVFSSSHLSSSTDSATDYLSGAGLIEIEDGKIQITSFGRALVEDANHVEDDSDVAVTFKKDDPYAYQKLWQTLSAPNMLYLIDPYFKADYLGFIITTSIQRILVANSVHGNGRKELISLELALGGLEAQGRDMVEVRSTDAANLHDRYVIGKDGATYMIGRSINGIGRSTTIFLPLPLLASKAIKDEMEQLWNQGRPVCPKKPTEIETLDE